MQCARCEYHFCWCCMGPKGDGHLPCPEFPYSMCCNILIVLAFIIFTPAMMVLIPFFGILLNMMIYYPYNIAKHKENCCHKTIIWLLFILLLTAPALVGGMTLALIAGALALIPIYLFLLYFLIRLCYVGCKAKI